MLLVDSYNGADTLGIHTEIARLELLSKRHDGVFVSPGILLAL